MFDYRGIFTDESKNDSARADGGEKPLLAAD
jgi:hypothetical protein